MDFRIVLQSRSGVPRGELHKVKSAVWSWVLNGEGAASIVISADDARATEELLTHAPLCVIYSDTGNWGGVVKRDIAQSGKDLTIGISGNARLLRRRITARTRSLDGYANGVIASTLLREANTMWPTGVTVGDYIYSGGASHFYEIHYDDLLDRFQDMAENDGHDFTVTWDRKLNWYERKGSDKANVVLSQGRNVVRWPTFKYSEDKIVNDQHVAGEGQTWATKITSRKQDLASQNSYGFWQQFDDYSNVSDQDTLDLRAETLKANRKDPSRVLDISIVDRPSGLLDSFSEGDRVRVILPSYNFGAGLDEMVKVLARELNAVTGVMRLVVEVGSGGG